MLIASNCYAEKLKGPFKVCPERPKTRDYPCLILGPTAIGTTRLIKEEITDNNELKYLKEENRYLKEKLETLMTNQNQ